MIPKKWIPVFGKACPRARPEGSCSNNKVERDGDSKKSHLALALRYARVIGAITTICLSRLARAAMLPSCAMGVAHGADADHRNQQLPVLVISSADLDENHRHRFRRAGDLPRRPRLQGDAAALQPCRQGAGAAR